MSKNILIVVLALTMLSMGCSLLNKESKKTKPLPHTFVTEVTTTTTDHSVEKSRINVVTPHASATVTRISASIKNTTLFSQTPTPVLTPIHAPITTQTTAQTLIPITTPVQTISTTQKPTSVVMDYRCLTILDKIPNDQSLEGILVFTNDNNTDAFLMDMRTGTQTRFPRKEGDRLFSFEVSPDGKLLLYRKNSDQGDITIIAKANNQTIWSDPIWYGWFSRDRLSFLVNQDKGNPFTVILNPFTEKRQELYPDYPNINLFNNTDVKWGGATSLPVYDPILSRVVYPECDPECHERLSRLDAGWPVVLWDLENNKSVAKLITMDTYGNTPKWTSDGSQFIISTDLLAAPSPYYRNFDADEFYSVSRDGLIRQMTYFTTRFSDSKIYNSYSLSPDNQFVAFWIDVKPDVHTGARLAILDIKSGDVTNYCIENSSPDITVAPMWSPDSRKLLLNLPDPSDNIKRDAVLVDIENGWAAEVIKNWILWVGW